MTIVSPFLTFPNTGWWMQVAGAGLVILDKGEHFSKMSYRNRYRISGANNPILLTVPLVRGRNQREPMAGVQIFNEERWQVQHWRTLVSVYKRSPFFDHYEDSLRPLYEQQFTYLIDFNIAALEWAQKQLKLPLRTELTETYQKEYPPEVKDLRIAGNAPADFPRYYQVFEDRIGFQADLSILDLLFSEGPGARGRLIGCKS